MPDCAAAPLPVSVPRGRLRLAQKHADRPDDAWPRSAPSLSRFRRMVSTITARRFSASLQNARRALRDAPRHMGSVDCSRTRHRFFDLLAQLGKPIDDAPKIAGGTKEPLQGRADDKTILASFGNRRSKLAPAIHLCGKASAGAANPRAEGARPWSARQL